MQILLVFSPGARQVETLALTLQQGSCVAQALAQPSVLNRWPTLASGPLNLGIWGQPCDAAHVLHDGDRLEIYRTLVVDPKEARRERFAKQGRRTAGLFARKSPASPKG